MIRLSRALAATLAGAVACLVGVSLLTSPGSQSTTAAAAARHAAPAAESQPDRSVFGPYSSPQRRARTDRDSGHDETLMFLDNVNFRLFGNIGYFAEKVVVAARPNRPADPLVLDDPKSFGLTVLAGRVVVSPASLTELLNGHVLHFDGAPLRAVQVTTKLDRLTIGGELDRHDHWVSFTMEGSISLADETTIAFTPLDVTVGGASVLEALKAAYVDLDEILKLDAPGLTLKGSVIVMKPDQLFPPPALSIRLKSVAVDERGLSLEALPTVSPTFPAPLERRASYVMVKGGDVKFLNVMPVDVLMQIVALDPREQLDFSLYDYRAQIAHGRVKLRADGSIVAYLKNYSELPPEERLQ